MSYLFCGRLDNNLTTLLYIEYYTEKLIHAHINTHTRTTNNSTRPPQNRVATTPTNGTPPNQEHKHTSTVQSLSLTHTHTHIKHIICTLSKAHRNTYTETQTHIICSLLLYQTQHIHKHTLYLLSFSLKHNTHTQTSHKTNFRIWYEIGE